MITENPQGIIELGNVSIKCLIFKLDDDQSLEILSTSTMQSEGIHNGVIVNKNKAVNAIRSCIGSAEKQAKTSIKKINVVMEQTEFLCTKFSKHKKIDGSMIHKEDIEFLLKEAKKQVIMNDDKQSIIHIFNHNYIVDGKTFIDEPIDVYADSLSHEMTFITMPKNNLKTIHQTFVECDIEIERFISCTFALGARLLDNNALQFGSILIDFGFEKTSIGFFKNLALVHSITFPIGVNHIIKDISKVCLLSLDDAKTITNKIDFSFKNNKDLFDKNGSLKDSFFKNSKVRKISENLLINIIKSRIDEIFEMIKKQIVLSKLNTDSDKTIFFVGGGSNIYNFEDYASNFFKQNVKKLDKNSEADDNKENLNSCLGALKIIKDGWETEAIPEQVSQYGKKTSFFAKFFGIKT